MSNHLSPQDLLAQLKETGVTQKDIASFLGIPQSAVSNISRGLRRMQHDEYARLSNLLRGSTKPRTLEIPIIGLSGAGQWVEAIEQTDNFLTLPSVIGSNELRASFAVEVVGDSMDQIMPEGTFAVIDTGQVDLFSSACYLLMNPEGEATIKRYRSDPARFEPVSSNPEYKPFNVGTTDFRVIGRVVYALRKF
jgi:SOS-response transcriptional repressor LexA